MTRAIINTYEHFQKIWSKLQRQGEDSQKLEEEHEVQLEEE